MNTDIRKEGRNVTARISGRLDTITSPELEKALSESCQEPGITLLIDCTDMEYISSTGLRVILMFHKKVTSAGGTFIVANLSSEVRSVFDMTGFSRILNIQ